MKQKEQPQLSRYYVCLLNKGQEVSLTPGRLYKRIPDKRGEEMGYVRVIDDTKEDYLFPLSLFAPVDLPARATRVLSKII